jgi:hypothetical protein
VSCVSSLPFMDSFFDRGCLDKLVCVGSYIVIAHSFY